MSHDDQNMGTTFPSWTSDAERNGALTMPAWGVEGEVPEGRKRVPGYERFDGKGAPEPLSSAECQRIHVVLTVGETPEEGEWPARDRVPEYTGLMRISGWEAPAPTAAQSAWLADNPIGLAPVEVTEEMELAVLGIIACLTTPDECGGLDEMHGFARRICEAAIAHQQVPLASDAEIALTRERDELRDRLTETTIAMNEARQEVASFHGLYEQHRIMAQTVMGLRTELMAARDMIAAFTAANIAAPTPDPIAHALNVSRKAPKWP